MSSTIIELREKEGINNSINNGEWETQLSEPLELNDGDVVQIANTFIDTEASENQKINIEKAITVEIQSMFHLMRTRLDGQLTFDDPAVAPDPEEQDGRAYFACTKESDKGIADFYTADTLYYPVLNDNNEGYGNVTLELQYQGLDIDNPPNRITKTVKIYLPPADQFQGPGTDAGNWVKFPPITYYSQLPVKWGNMAEQQGSGFTILNGGDLNGANVGTQMSVAENSWHTYMCIGTGSEINSKKWNYAASDPANIDTFTPATTTTTFQIPSGNYDPDDLVLTINKELQRNATPDDQNIVFKTPFMVSNTGNNPANLLLMNQDTYYDTGKQLYMIREDGQNGFVINGTTDQYIIGASQMELSYDPSQQRFVWSYVHMPFFANSTQTEANTSGNEYVGWIVMNGSKVPVTRNGGVSFRSLRAYVTADNTPYDFWEGKLGFDLASMIGKSTTTEIAIGGDIVKVGLYPLTPGTNTTTGFLGIQNGVNLTGANGAWWQLFNSANNLMSTTTFTREIKGDSNILSTAFTFGYFLIEIQAQIDGKFITANDNLNFIRQIVGRYYSVNSYTSSSDQGIQYIHKGEPMILSSFKVRILSSDKTVAKNLGDDSTVFLELIKNEKPQ